MHFQLEICANSIRSALAAQQGGADRIELCDNMAEGGTTPSYGLISICKKLLQIPVFPIVRPRGGDFLNLQEEFEVMKQDVITCRALGCEGVAIGMLTEYGSIDIERCAELIALARPMQVTFHRAFDRCNNLEKGLEDIIRMGCERVLTSGGEVYATDGIKVLKKLVHQAKGRISIMPGSGINEENIFRIAKNSGAHEFHSTAKSFSDSKTKLLNPGNLAQADGLFQLLETDPERVQNMKQVLLGMQ